MGVSVLTSLLSKDFVSKIRVVDSGKASGIRVTGLFLLPLSLKSHPNNSPWLVRTNAVGSSVLRDSPNPAVNLNSKYT